MEDQGVEINLTVQVRQIEAERVKVIREMEALVTDFRRRAPAFQNGSLYLKIKKHHPRCRSCPHGPYWHQACFTRQRKWIGRYIGKQLTKSRIYQLWNYRNVRLLMEFDQRAKTVRERKRELLKMLATMRRLLRRV